MKAIGLIPGTTHVQLIDRPEPACSAPDEVKMRVLRVGICGTDREEVSGGRALAPQGQKELVIGHENFGQIVEVGSAVRSVKPGDYAVFTVRRGCGKCLPCLMNRSDMCRTGEYRERGIWGLDGYQTEFVVDRERFVVQVPPELEPIGVLCEPLTIAEKAIGEAARIQWSRVPDAPSYPDWPAGRRCLVAGLGPVGLLAAVALQLRGAEVYGLDIVPADAPRARWLEAIGGRYLNGRDYPSDRIVREIGPMELIFEAAGVPKLDFNLLATLDFDGVFVLTGIPGGDPSIPVSAALFLRELVLKNQILFGSVNAAHGHFQMAIHDLGDAFCRWGDHLEHLITHRYPFTDFPKAFGPHDPGEIKAVIEWAQTERS